MNDNLNNTPKSCNLLQDIATKARENLIMLNIYQNETGKQYTATHPNATQATGGVDDRQNTKGKGTGEYMDTSNGGGSLDINGRSDVSGSGRKNLLMLNKYSKEKPYDCFPT